MTISLKHVAQHAGVSVPSASQILNHRNLPFGEETKRRVFAAAAALGYRPDAIAGRTGRGLTRRDAIGFLLRSEAETDHNMANAPAFEFLCGINDVLLERHQFLATVKLAQLQPTDGFQEPRLIAERFIDGLIVDTGLSEELERKIDAHDIPTVWLNTSRHDPCDCVYPDEFHAGRLATEHLLQLGHREIVFLSSRRMHDLATADTMWPHFSADDRPAGYAAAMASAGLCPQVIDRTAGNVSRADSETGLIDYAVALAAQTRKNGRPVTGVVACALDWGVRLWHCLEHAGLRCPVDVSIAVCDDLHVFRRQWPEISGVTCDRYQMGRWAADMILSKVDAKGTPQASKVYQAKWIPGCTAGSVRSGGTAPRRARTRKEQTPQVGHVWPVRGGR